MPAGTETLGGSGTHAGLQLRRQVKALRFIDSRSVVLSDFTLTVGRGRKPRCSELSIIEMVQRIGALMDNSCDRGWRYHVLPPYRCIRTVLNFTNRPLIPGQTPQTPSWGVLQLDTGDSFTSGLTDLKPRSILPVGRPSTMPGTTAADPACLLGRPGR